VEQLDARTLQRIAKLVEHVTGHGAPSCKGQVDALARVVLSEIDHDTGGKTEGERTIQGGITDLARADAKRSRGEVLKLESPLLIRIHHDRLERSRRSCSVRR
jgi:hypothetical protein